MDSRTIRKSGIRQRHAGIDRPVAPGHDLLDHIFQTFPGGKAFSPAPQLPVFFYINLIIPIDHDLVYPWHLQKLLHQIQLSHCIIQLRLKL